MIQKVLYKHCSSQSSVRSLQNRGQLARVQIDTLAHAYLGTMSVSLNTEVYRLALCLKGVCKVGCIFLNLFIIVDDGHVYHRERLSEENFVQPLAFM